MKYRIIAGIVVIAVLVVLYAVTQDSTPATSDGGMRIGMLQGPLFKA